MNKVISDIEKEKTFEQMLNESFISLEIGQVVEGKVVCVNPKEILLDIGYKYDGVIKKEYFSNVSDDLQTQVKLGETIKAVIVKIDDADGKVFLSKKKLELQDGVQKLEVAFKNGMIITGKVIGYVQSGLNVIFEGVRLFVPISCMSDKDGDLKSYVGKEIKCKIIEFNRVRNRYIGSQIDIKNMQEIGVSVGDRVDCIVKKIVDFGVFVDFGKNSGLLHVSQIKSCDRENFKDKFKVGDKLKLFIKNIDKKRGRIALSESKDKKNVWVGISERYPDGKIIQGRVLRISDFGAFVELEKGIDGLLHISQICEDEHIEKVTDKINIGDVLKLKVLSSDEENKKIALSLIGVDQK